MTKLLEDGPKKEESPIQNNGTKTKIAKAYDSPSWWYDIRGFFYSDVCLPKHPLGPNSVFR